MNLRGNKIAAATALGLGAFVAALPAAAGAGGLAKANTKQVKVLDNHYTPTSVNIHKGDRVKWTWGSSNKNPHSVTLQSGPKGVKISQFRSPIGTTGITFKRKFTVKGTYKFHCTVHPTSMKMQVVVNR